MPRGVKRLRLKIQLCELWAESVARGNHLDFRGERQIVECLSVEDGRVSVIGCEDEPLDNPRPSAGEPREHDVDGTRRNRYAPRPCGDGLTKGARRSTKCDLYVSDSRWIASREGDGKSGLDIGANAGRSEGKRV